MQTSPATPIPVPEVEADEPVAVIPVASVAPLEGAPDGERINTFAIAPVREGGSWGRWGEDLRERVLGKPLTAVAAAFALGVIFARALR
jgi:hypothetical protein